MVNMLTDASIFSNPLTHIERSNWACRLHAHITFTVLRFTYLSQSVSDSMINAGM